MANEKVSQMVSLAAAEVVGSDLFMIVDTSARESKKISVSDVIIYFESTGSFNNHSILADTASYIQGSNVAGVVNSASNAQNVASASHALRSNTAITASFALNVGAISGSGTTLFTGSTYQITSSAARSASYAINSTFASSSGVTQFLQYTGINNGTSSFAITSSKALSTTSSSYAITASYSTTSSSSFNAISAVNAQNADFATYSGAKKYAIIYDRRSSGGAAEVPSFGAWTKKDLNTIDCPSGIAALYSTNKFTLVAGTYKIEAMQFHGQAICMLRLYDEGASSVINTGIGINSGNNGSNVAEVMSIVTLVSSTPTTMSLQYYLTNNGGSSNWLGQPLSITSTPETYTIINVIEI